MVPFSFIGPIFSCPEGFMIGLNIIWAMEVSFAFLAFLTLFDEGVGCQGD